MVNAATNAAETNAEKAVEKMIDAITAERKDVMTDETTDVIVTKSDR